MKSVYVKIKAMVFVLLLAGANNVLAQGAHLELNAGVEFGWWFHQLGPAELGIAKTHHLPAPFVSLSWLWSLKKWRIGPMLHGGALIEDDMRGPFDSRRRSQRIPIAEENRAIPSLRYGLHVEYTLLRRGAYSFAPAFRYGAIQWSTLHPDRENFGYHQFGEVVLHHIWHRPKRDFMLRMTYNSQRLFLKEPNDPLEQHHLYFWGTSLGIRF